MKTMLRQLTVTAAWACLIFIAYATLSPASARPELTSAEPVLVVFIERFGHMHCWDFYSIWPIPAALHSFAFSFSETPYFLRCYRYSFLIATRVLLMP